MGQKYSYLNVCALATIVHFTHGDIERTFAHFEKSYMKTGDVSEEKRYIVTEGDFMQLINETNYYEKDQEIFINLFYIIDNRGFGYIDIRDIFISVAVLTSKSVSDCVLHSFQFYDRAKTQLLRKPELYLILRRLNEVCHYFGDKSLDITQVQDLVDSAYTSAGKIDGTIFFPNFVEYIATHPIVEMFMSPQFQGPLKDKLYDADDFAENKK